MDIIMKPKMEYLMEYLLKIRKIGKIARYCNASQICSKTIKKYSL